MNRDITVLIILTLLLFLDGVGAIHFLPALAGPEGGWLRKEPIAVIAALGASGAVLISFSLLVFRRILTRIS